MTVVLDGLINAVMTMSVWMMSTIDPAKVNDVKIGSIPTMNPDLRLVLL